MLKDFKINSVKDLYTHECVHTLKKNPAVKEAFKTLLVMETDNSHVNWRMLYI